MRRQKLFQCFTLAVAILAIVFVFAPQAARAECGVYHTVLAGQNLFRISLRYGVSIQAIASANGIADVRRIYAGQTLYIPCGSGTPTTPTTPTYPTTGYPTNPLTPSYIYPIPVPLGTAPTTGTVVVPAPIIGTVDCSGFRATSPLDGFRDGVVTFYWDSPRSIDSFAIYQVIILDDRGTRIASFSAGGGLTRTNGNVGFEAIGGRSRFSWYVVALANGNEVCRTQIYTVPREWNPNAGLSP